jgi:glycerol-3-phosphate dehydrogenase
LKGKRLQLTKGVHLVFPYEKLPLQQAAYFDVGDGRMIFAIPRNNITYVGTTDTVYNQNLDKPQCNKEDVEYLLAAVNRIFPDVKLQQHDIVSSWAGLRPLIYEEGKSASELSRKDEIMISDSGLISIAGGKLTGYRLMAGKVVDLVAKKLNKDFGKSSTKNFRLSGGDFKNEKEFRNTLEKFQYECESMKIPLAKIKEWFFRYGTNMHLVLKNVGMLSSSTTKEKVYEQAELLYCIEHEMVYSLSDYLVRRTGKIFFEHASAQQQIEGLNQILSEQLNLSSGSSEKSLLNAKEEFEAAVTFR